MHSTTPSATGAIPVQVSTRRPVARGEERIGNDNNADVCKKAVKHEFFLASGSFTEFFGWTAKNTDIGASVR